MRAVPDPGLHGRHRVKHRAGRQPARQRARHDGHGGGHRPLPHDARMEPGTRMATRSWRTESTNPWPPWACPSQSGPAAWSRALEARVCPGRGLACGGLHDTPRTRR